MKKNKLAYFVCKANVFGIGYYLLFKTNNKNAYLVILLGTLIGIGVLYIYSKIKKTIKDQKLIDVLKKSKTGIIYLLFFILFDLLLITIITIVLSTFVNSFYLVNTPKSVIIIPFILLSIYLIYKPQSSLLNISVLFFWLSFVIVTTFSFLLIPYINFNEVLPIFNYNMNNIFIGSIIYASLTSIPEILVIDYYDDFKNIYKDYILGSLINFLILIGTILALGMPLITIYDFPEYDVLKQIKIFDFIENIENISAFGWYLELFIYLSLIISHLKDLLPKKHNKTLLIIILSIVVYISAFVIGGNYIRTLNLVCYYIYILLGSLFIFITLLFFLKQKK